VNGTTKDLRAAVRRLQHEGWTSSPTGSGHVLLRHPCGARVVASKSPSSPHATQYLRGDVRRALAAKAAPTKEKAATRAAEKA
jgi:predicted RNA binding protein YcfA (HicA-like mRNA interferase family)